MPIPDCLKFFKKKPPHAPPQERVNQKYTDGLEGTLVYIHIGKCGGATLRRAIKQSPIVNKNFSRVERVHVKKPFYQKHPKYLIVLRNPIDRALSAFNWRYRLVVETKEQEFRFEGEYEILKKYDNLNNFAEHLYTDESPNLPVVKEWQAVHHLKEDIDFYLSPLLGMLRKDQLFGVMTTEYLNDDISNLLRVNPPELVHENKSKVPSEKLALSDLAVKNLRKFLDSDYRAIQKLHELYGLKQTSLDRLLQ